MDVDRMAIGRLSEAEAEEYKRKGLCFYCKERGHMKNKCPKLAKKQAKEPAKVQAVKAEETNDVVLPPSGNAARIAAVRRIMEGAGEEEKTEVLKDMMDF